MEMFLYLWDLTKAFISFGIKYVYIGDNMVDKAIATGKNVSIYMSDDTIAMLDMEAGIQNLTKSKIIRIALMRYVDERELKRDYMDALEEIRGKTYE